MKKILFVAPFPPPIHGAALRNQTIAESKLVNRLFILRTFAANQASDVNDIGRFSWRKILKTAKDIAELIGVLRSFRPDLVYFNISLFGFALYRDALYSTIFKLGRFKLLYHLRTQGIQDQIEKSLFKRVLFKYLFYNVDVICLSSKLSLDIAGVYQHKPFIVGNGIPVEHICNQTSRKNAAIPKILFLSNLNIKKGIDELLLAFQMLNKKKLPFEGIIVGRSFDYTEIEVIQKCAKLGIKEKVNVVGPLYGKEKIKMLISADIFALPTYFEAFPGVVLEAMQFGLPVISSFEGAIPEIVQHGKTGLLIEKQNVQQLTDALELLINDQPLREKFGTSGKEHFFQNYTLEAFEENMTNVFNHVLNDHGNKH